MCTSKFRRFIYNLNKKVCEICGKKTPDFIESDGKYYCSKKHYDLR